MTATQWKRRLWIELAEESLRNGSERMGRLYMEWALADD